MPTFKRKPPTQEDFNEFYEEFMNFLLENEGKVILMGEEHGDIGSIPYYLATMDLQTHFGKNISFKGELSETRYKVFLDENLDGVGPLADKKFTTFKLTTKEAFARNINFENNDELGDVAIEKGKYFMDERSIEMGQDIVYGIQKNGKALEEELADKDIHYVIQQQGSSHLKTTSQYLESEGIEHKVVNVSSELKSPVRVLWGSFIANIKDNSIDDNIWRKTHAKTFSINGDVSQLDFRTIIEMTDKARDSYIKNHPELNISKEIAKKEIKREYTLDITMQNALHEYRIWDEERNKEENTIYCSSENLINQIDELREKDFYNNIGTEVISIIDEMYDIATNFIPFGDITDDERSSYTKLYDDFNSKIKDINNKEAKDSLNQIKDEYANLAWAIQDEDKAQDKLEELNNSENIKSLKNKGFIR